MGVLFYPGYVVRDLMQKSCCPLVRWRFLTKAQWKGLGRFRTQWKKTPLWFSGSEAETRWQSTVLGLYQKAVSTLACDVSTCWPWEKLLDDWFQTKQREKLGLVYWPPSSTSGEFLSERWGFYRRTPVIQSANHDQEKWVLATLARFGSEMGSFNSIPILELGFSCIPYAQFPSNNQV